MNKEEINFPVEFNDDEKNLFLDVSKKKFSMVSKERMFATMMSCKYAVENNIPGDFVECGVWRGGNAILAAGIFKLYGSDKKVWCYDTFGGFLETDRYKTGKTKTTDNTIANHNAWYNTENCGNSFEDVKANFKSMNLLSDNICFVKGDVEQTLKSDDVPSQVSVLRLDTDMYDSTLMELNILYPKLSVGGILMIDDYNYHNNQRKAVDEYFESKKKPFLQYIDKCGRIGIKV